MKRVKALKQMRVVNELVLVVRRSPVAGGIQTRVVIRNADPADLPMARALAQIYALWINSGRSYE